MTAAQLKQGDTRATILRQAVTLFADQGYSAVSMRDIAGAVGTSAAALYHHFPDKQTLYLEALRSIFGEFAEGLNHSLDVSGSVEQRLERFVRAMVELFGQSPLYRRLHQRVLLDADVVRSEALVGEMFGEQFAAVVKLIGEIAPGCDAHMLAFSISGMVIHHYEMAPMRHLFPGSGPQHEDPAYITSHITRLLLRGIKG